MAFDYHQLQALSAVYKESSFQRAAQHLLVTQSAISQRIKTLEDSVGEPLLIRSNPPKLTALGHQYVSTFEQIDALYNSLSKSPSEQVPKISIAVNEESFDIWFNRCSIELTKKHNILFNLFIDDQDLTSRYLKEAKVLGCLSSEKGPIQGCLSYPLKATKYICVARKSFIDKYDLQSNTVQKFLNAPTAIYGPNDRIHDRFLAQVLKTNKIPPYKAHTIPSVTGIQQQIVEGGVFAVMPSDYVEDMVERGELINMFPKEVMIQNLYWHVVQTEIPILKEITKTIIGLRG